ncbi:hypothetical protein KY360_05570 [Candidatus Woesearchaeota archaeon]|nr:hypothetical protein [Candidatus Woesearchaeota archaeon]
MNLANKIMPYLLPIITIISLLVVFITKPAITGFVAAEQEDNTETTKIKISSTTIIPEGSIVEITANNQTYEFTMEEFILKSGNTPEYIYGNIPEINYSGKGYIGDYSASLDILGIDTSLTVQPTVYIIHNDIIIYKKEIIV